MTAPIPAMPLLHMRGFLKSRRAYPFPFEESSVSFWYNARAAIWQGVRCIGLGAGDRVLVPAYCCGAEVDVLLKAGLTLDFYRVLPDLSPDLDHLDDLCRVPVRALFVIHYFGFSQPMERILAFARDRDILVIEDGALALYSTDDRGRPLGSFGDMAVFSLCKTLPVPDGGLLLVKPQYAKNGLPSLGRGPHIRAVAGRVHYLVEEAVGWRFPTTASILKRGLFDPVTRSLKRMIDDRSETPTGPFGAEKVTERIDLDLAKADWRMSRVARILLRAIDHDRVREIRRRNFQALLAGLAPGTRMVPLKAELTEGCCPWFFPIVVHQDREYFKQFLMAHGIGHFRIWIIRHEHVPLHRFPFEARLKQSVFALPVHQDLDTQQMSMMADLLNRWGRKEGVSSGVKEAL